MTKISELSIWRNQKGCVYQDQSTCVHIFNERRAEHVFVDLQGVHHDSPTAEPDLGHPATQGIATQIILENYPGRWDACYLATAEKQKWKAVLERRLGEDKFSSDHPLRLEIGEPFFARSKALKSALIATEEAAGMPHHKRWPLSQVRADGLLTRTVLAMVNEAIADYGWGVQVMTSAQGCRADIFRQWDGIHARIEEKTEEALLESVLQWFASNRSEIER